MQILFAESERSTIGIEWELALVDASTGDLVQIADQVLRELGTPDGREHPQITHELLMNTVELVSRVHRTVPAAIADLQDLMGLTREVTDPLGVELMCAGTHPFAQWYDQKVTPNERYDRLLDRTQWWGRQMMIWGIHVHVGIDERDKALPIVNGLLTYYPHLQALSASSPFWAGARTGYASNRALMFRSSPPPACRGSSGPGRTTRSTCRTWSRPEWSRTTARCAGTSDHRRDGERSRCAPATGSRPRTKSARSPRSSTA